MLSIKKFYILGARSETETQKAQFLSMNLKKDPPLAVSQSNKYRKIGEYVIRGIKHDFPFINIRRFQGTLRMLMNDKNRENIGALYFITLLTFSYASTQCMIRAEVKYLLLSTCFAW